MAIHAQKTSFRSSAQFPDFLVTSPIQQNDFLVWCDQKRAFVNITADDVVSILGTVTVTGTTPGTVAGAVNLGSGTQSFVQNNSGILEFRTIAGGTGITVMPGVSEIFINNDIVSTSSVSAPDSFKIIIDSDGDTECSAQFQLCTLGNLADQTFEPLVYLAPNLSLNIVADPLGINPGQIISTNYDFVAGGFRAGQCLRISGSNEQDGVWEISDITTTNSLNDTITITVPFPDATDAGLQPPVTLEAMFWRIAGPQTIEILGGFDFISAGFQNGQTITISGTTDNDGVYTVGGVTGTTLSIVETFPGTLGCDVATINIQTPLATVPTGFAVDECGNTMATSVVTDYLESATGAFSGDVTIGDLSVSNQFTVGGQTIQQIADALIPEFPRDGLLAQTAAGVYTAREIQGGAGITVTNGDGIAGDPVVDLDSFAISLSGVINGTGTVTPGLDTTITTTHAPSGVIGGSYNRLTVNSAGIVTFGANQTIDTTGGITVANADGVAGNPTLSARDMQLTLQGHVQGSALISDLADTTINVSLAPTGVVANTYNKVTVDYQGRVVSGQNQPIQVGQGLKITNADGVVGNPTISLTDFNLTFSGDVQGTGNIADLSDTTISLELAPITAPGTYTRVVVDNKGRVISGSQAPVPPLVLPQHLQTLSTGFIQPGYVVWTGAGYTQSTIQGRLNEIEVTHGDGDPSTEIGLADDPIVPGRGAITVPRGFGVERPSVPRPGMFRYEIAAAQFEGYNGTTWQPLLFGSPADYLPTAGGTMSGNIDMAGGDIITPGLIDGRDIAVDGMTLDAINTGTGIKVQVGPDQFENREIKAVAGSGITVSDGDGVASDPRIGFDLNLVSTLNFAESPQPDDHILIYDQSSGTMQKVSLHRTLVRPAHRYFMAQI